MAEISLTKGHVAIVDDEDYDALAQYKWCSWGNGRGHVYAVRSISGHRLVYMHRVIADARPGQQTDHINGNTLDNRRANLRACTGSENQHNRAPKHNSTSGYKGVSVSGDKWMASIRFSGRTTNLGYFDSPEGAAAAYDRAAIELFGEFARLNLQEV